jgi:Escherichia/Staphylococcus phage prohead protease
MERRFLRKSAPAVTPDGKLHGRAIAYDQWTMIGQAPWGFREKVNPKALNKAVNDGDMVLLDNHDTAKPLARQSAGTLILRNTSEGLDWDANPPDTTYAQDAAKNAKAGNFGGCSFGFDVVREKWSTGEDGIEERELLELKVPEISVCTFPAYDQTSVSARDSFAAAMEARTRFYEHELRAKYTQAEVDALGAKGQAFKNPDGHYSYPIADGDVDDLKNAIHAVGRGGASHDAIRKYIMSRAKALGQSALIPDTWQSDGSIGEANAAPKPAETRAPKASYADVQTCGDCGATGQYGSYCSNCGGSMTNAKAGGKYCTSCGGKLNSSARSADADEHRDSVDGDSPKASAPTAKASNGQHQDHPPVTGSHTHAGDDSAHTHSARNGYDHSERNEPVTSTRDDERRRMRLRMAEASFGLEDR